MTAIPMPLSGHRAEIADLLQQIECAILNGDPDARMMACDELCTLAAQEMADAEAAEMDIAATFADNNPRSM